MMFVATLWLLSLLFSTGKANVADNASGNDYDCTRCSQGSGIIPG